MAFKKKIYRFPNAIEVEEFHTARYGAPGEPRAKRRKATPEEIERVNRRNKEKKCRHRLRTYFDVNDYFVTVTYEKDQRPADMEEAKQHFREFIRVLRKEYARRGEPLRWIRNIEVGSRGAWHVHLVVNRIQDTDIIIRDAWQRGRVVGSLLYDRGEFRDLAAYMTKDEKTDTRLREASYSTSRNMPLPEPEEKIYHRWRTWPTDPKVPEGFFLDKETVREGINPVTGHRFRTYTLLRRREGNERHGKAGP